MTEAEQKQANISKVVSFLEEHDPERIGNILKLFLIASNKFIVNKRAVRPEYLPKWLENHRELFTFAKVLTNDDRTIP